MVPAVYGMEERVRDLRMPVTIFAGTEDRVVDHETHAVWLHETIPTSDLRLVAGAGHMVHYAAPDEVADAIEQTAQAGRVGAPRVPGLAAHP